MVTCSTSLVHKNSYYIYEARTIRGLYLKSIEHGELRDCVITNASHEGHIMQKFNRNTNRVVTATHAGKNGAKWQAVRHRNLCLW